MTHFDETKYYIGYCTDSEHRFKASSGGVGTLIQKYLLESGQFGTSITFRFDQNECLYKPVLIYKGDEVNVCGSVYQDINILSFVRDNIKMINNGIVVSCPPCQVDAIKRLLNNAGIPNFIISFCCSGQTTIEGTWKYYQLLGINKNDVVNIQYRGNGWPSGIQIELKDGTTCYHNNWTEPWSTIHSSGFYRPKRCFFCQFDTSRTSDISLADPWLKGYLEKDKVGHTIFLINTERGSALLSDMKNRGLIEMQPITYATYLLAQNNNVAKSSKVKTQLLEIKTTKYLAGNKFLKYFFTKNHTRLKAFLKMRRYILFITRKFK